MRSESGQRHASLRTIPVPIENPLDLGDEVGVARRVSTTLTVGPPPTDPGS